MGSKRITPDQKKAFARALAEGWTVEEAAPKAGVSVSWARKNGHLYRPLPTTPHPTPTPPSPTSSSAPPQNIRSHQPEDGPGWVRPLAIHELHPIALDCLDDFARFRHRYFGRISSPWQEHAAEVVVERLATPDKEFGVINVAPGGGKSTLFTHDIPAWLTCRSRSLRGFIGSGTQTTANSYTSRLRNTFERPIPQQAQSEEKALGLAYDAESTLIQDYGLFKPPPDIGAPWSKSQFTVAQIGETRISEKEATWTAFGEDTRFLGWRVNFIVWDDLVTAASVRTAEAINAQRSWWINEAQTRLEPGGLLMLQGQRLHAEDLYRYCLDMETGHELLDAYHEDLGIEVEPSRKKYFHVVYKAHYDEHCRAAEDPALHRLTAPPYDPSHPTTSGCLLDPVRLSHRELMTIKDQPLTNYDVVYQQEDSSPNQVLVPKYYIYGGKDPETPEVYPGCLDYERDLNQLPPPGYMQGTRLSVVTVDPAPTNFWSIQWWLYVQPERADELMGYRFLINMIRTPMGADDLLDWNVAQATYTGILETWHNYSKALGIPFSNLVVEVNAAQKFLTQYSWFRDWQTLRSVTLIPHTTTVNKADQELGVGILKPHYRYGRVHLPWAMPARPVIKQLIHELTHYPDTTTTDCLMANWFFEHQLPNLVDSDTPHPSLYNDIPSWVQPQSPFHPMFAGLTNSGMN